MLKLHTPLEEFHEFRRLQALFSRGRCLAWMVCPNKQLEDMIIATLAKTTGYRVGSASIPAGTRDFYEYVGNIMPKQRNCLFLTDADKSLTLKYQNLMRLNNPPDYLCVQNLESSHQDISRRQNVPAIIVTGSEGEALIAERAPNFQDFVNGFKFCFHLLEDGKEEYKLSMTKDGSEREWCDACQAYH